MSLAWRRIAAGFAIALMTASVAVVGYVLLGASFVDALYMVVITIFSVGYEESVSVDTPGSKLFTIFVILAGCSSLLYVIGGFIEMATEGEIKRALGARRMTRGIGSLTNHAIICGFGRMGQMLAKELHERHHPFVLIEKSDGRLSEAEEHGYWVLAGDATEEETLEAARIEHAKTLATVLPHDASNVFITLSARNLNAGLIIIARGAVLETEAKLRQAGANQVVLPAAIGGLRMANMIARPAASHMLANLENAEALNNDLDQLGVQVNEILIPNRSDIVGKTIEQVEIEGDGAYLVVAIRRSDGSLHYRPEGDFTLQQGDAIIVIGHGDAAPELTTRKTRAREIFSRAKRKYRRRKSDRKPG